MRFVANGKLLACCWQRRCNEEDAKKKRTCRRQLRKFLSEIGLRFLLVAQFLVRSHTAHSESLVLHRLHFQRAHQFFQNTG
jgi:hypothetical protein